MWLLGLSFRVEGFRAVGFWVCTVHAARNHRAVQCSIAVVAAQVALDKTFLGSCVSGFTFWRLL